MALERLPLPSGIGIELRGVDLTRPIPPEVQDGIRAAWIDAAQLDPDTRRQGKTF